MGKPHTVVQGLVDKLIALGINFKKRGTFERHAAPVEVFAESILDDIIFRGVAKIAFNFLTYVKGPDFVLLSDFDDTREYIRTGKKPFLSANKRSCCCGGLGQNQPRHCLFGIPVQSFDISRRIVCELQRDLAPFERRPPLRPGELGRDRGQGNPSLLNSTNEQRC